jgi:hypothetical protein
VGWVPIFLPVLTARRPPAVPLPILGLQQTVFVPLGSERVISVGLLMITNKAAETTPGG